MARLRPCSLPLSICLALALAGCAPRPPDAEAVLRIGHFPNITHAQGLVAHALSRRGEGWFESRLGSEVKVEWYVYNAGPSAMEAFFAGSLDLTYVGPSPALNAYFRSEGSEPRIISGAALGGSALVVRQSASLEQPSDFRGRRIATPQFGNTQDVECRSWLAASGFQVTQLGGDVQVVPTANPEQLLLFQQGEIDAAWTVEPWVSVLETKGGGRIFVERKESVTTVLAARAAFLAESPELARRALKAHEELTQWIQDNPEEARRLVAEEIEAETTRAIPRAILDRAWPRLQFSTEISLPPLKRFVEMARSAGFLGEEVDLSRLVAEID